jgi:hypothetical protein
MGAMLCVKVRGHLGTGDSGALVRLTRAVDGRAA